MEQDMRHKRYMGLGIAIAGRFFGMGFAFLFAGKMTNALHYIISVLLISCRPLLHCSLYFSWWPRLLLVLVQGITDGRGHRCQCSVLGLGEDSGAV